MYYSKQLKFIPCECLSTLREKLRFSLVVFAVLIKARLLLFHFFFDTCDGHRHFNIVKCRKLLSVIFFSAQPFLIKSLHSFSLEVQDGVHRFIKERNMKSFSPQVSQNKYDSFDTSSSSSSSSREQSGILKAPWPSLRD